MSKRTWITGALTLLITLAAVALPGVESSRAAGELTPRAYLAVVARDAAILPSPDPSYCPSNTNPPSLPVSLFGTLTVSGSPVSAGTVVQVLLNGVAGPAAYVAQAGGYRVDFYTGPASCPNHVGATVGLIVGGRRVENVGTVTVDSGPLAINVVVP